MGLHMYEEYHTESWRYIYVWKHLNMHTNHNSGVNGTVHMYKKNCKSSLGAGFKW